MFSFGYFIKIFSNFGGLRVHLLLKQEGIVEIREEYNDEPQSQQV